MVRASTLPALGDCTSTSLGKPLPAPAACPPALSAEARQARDDQAEVLGRIAGGLDPPAQLGTCDLSTAQKLSFLLDVAYGLDYLHKQGVLHYDLKSANLTPR